MIFSRNLGIIVLVFVVMFSFLKNRVLWYVAYFTDRTMYVLSGEQLFWKTFSLSGNCFGSTKTTPPEKPTKIKRIPSNSGRSTPTRHYLPQPEPFMPLTFPLFRSFSFPRSQRRKSSSVVAANSLRLQPVTLLASSSLRERNRTDNRATEPLSSITKPRPVTPSARTNNRPVNLRPVQVPHRRRHSSVSKIRQLNRRDTISCDYDNSYDFSLWYRLNCHPGYQASGNTSDNGI
jgi:hypothetical protein